MEFILTDQYTFELVTFWDQSIFYHINQRTNSDLGTESYDIWDGYSFWYQNILIWIYKATFRIWSGQESHSQSKVNYGDDRDMSKDYLT